MSVAVTDKEIELQRSLSSVTAKLGEAVRTAEAWKRECEMFANAWSRELGLRRAKTHLIDELVVGTIELRTKAARVDALEAEVAEMRRKAQLERDIAALDGPTPSRTLVVTCRYEPPPLPPQPQKRIVRGFDPFGLVQSRADLEHTQNMARWSRQCEEHRRLYYEPAPTPAPPRPPLESR